MRQPWIAVRLVDLEHATRALARTRFGGLGDLRPASQRASPRHLLSYQQIAEHMPDHLRTFCDSTAKSHGDISRPQLLRRRPRLQRARASGMLGHHPTFPL